MPQQRDLLTLPQPGQASQPSLTVLPGAGAVRPRADSVLPQWVGRLRARCPGARRPSLALGDNPDCTEGSLPTLGERKFTCSQNGGEKTQTSCQGRAAVLNPPQQLQIAARCGGSASPSPTPPERQSWKEVRSTAPQCYRWGTQSR